MLWAYARLSDNPIIEFDGRQFRSELDEQVIKPSDCFKDLNNCQGYSTRVVGGEELKVRSEMVGPLVFSYVTSPSAMGLSRRKSNG